MSARPRSPAPPADRHVAVVVLMLIAAGGLGVHVWFVLGGDALDSDRALVLLMARDFAEGHFSLYFWQQNYMAAVEPLLLTPLALLGWATPVGAGVVAMALTCAMAALSVGLARRLGGAPWLALLIWAVPPAVVVHHHVSLYGARLAATTLALAAFAWSLRAHSARGWTFVGALTGLAYFADHLMLPWAAAVVFVGARRGALRPLALGAVPLVLLDSVAAMLTPAVHLSGPNDPGEWLRNIPLLFGTTLPQLFGLLSSRGPSPLFEPPSSLVPGGTLWPLFAVVGSMALLALLGTLVRRRRELLGQDAADGGLGTQALLVAVLSGLLLFAFVGGGGDRWPARYLVPLWPAVAVLASLAVVGWTPRLRPLAAAVVLPAVLTLQADDAWPRAGDGDRARAEASAVADAVHASGAQAVWADYWDAYRMALLVGEPPPWLPIRIIDRRPDLTLRAAEAGPAAYLVRKADQEVLGRLAEAGARGNRLVGERDVARWRLVVLERPVPELELRHPPPPRGWQMLAAASAGALFLGMLGVMGALARWAAPGPEVGT